MRLMACTGTDLGLIYILGGILCLQIVLFNILTSMFIVFCVLRFLNRKWHI